MMNQTQFERVATSKFLTVWDSGMKDSPDPIKQVYKTMRLGPQKPYHEHMARTGLPPAQEYQDEKLPDVQQIIMGQKKRTDPVLVGIRSQVGFTAWENRDINKIKDLGAEMSRSMRIKQAYKLHDPFILGFDATTRFKTAYGIKLWGTGHKLPGGYSFDTVGSSVTLEFNWDNLIANVKAVRTTHKDGRGIPQHFFRQKIFLVHGEEIAQQVHEVLQPGNKPGTAEHTRNYVNTMNIVPINTNWISDARWFLIDGEMVDRGFGLVIFERMPAQIMTPKVEDNDVRTFRSRAWYQNDILETSGMIGSQGLSS